MFVFVCVQDTSGSGAQRVVSSSCSLRGIEAGDEQRSRKQKVCPSHVFLYDIEVTYCILFPVTMFFIAEVSLDIPKAAATEDIFPEPQHLAVHGAFLTPTE